MYIIYYREEYMDVEKLSMNIRWNELKNKWSNVVGLIDEGLSLGFFFCMSKYFFFYVFYYSVDEEFLRF